MNTLILLTLSAAFADDVDRVPQDFATIQQAVDMGTAPIIVVAPGVWTGATVDRSVSIQAESGATIDRGVRVRKGVRAAFALTGGADNSEIHGFTMDCTQRGLDLGVYASVPRLNGAADGVVVSGNTFQSCVQGVTNQGSEVAECKAAVNGGKYWVIEDNRFDGFPTFTHGGAHGGGIGIALFNVQAADVISNRFSGQVQDTALFTTAGISMAGCHDCTVAANDFAVEGGEHYWVAVANHGFYQDGGAASWGLILSDNDASRDSAPHLGVSFRSMDSFDTEVNDNAGTAFLDHAHCGDGAIEVID